jgi:hypothetical protein
MKSQIVLAALLAGTCVLLQSGCEVEQTVQREGAAPESNSTNAQDPASESGASAPAATAGADELDISSARMLGPHKDMVAQHAAITRALYAANKAGDSVRLSFEPLSWPSRGSPKKIDGGVYLFWESGGGVVGGLFDWHGVGQTSKGLENVHGGYLDGQRPPGGAAIWFCIVSLNADERTNVARSDTPW